MDIVDLQVRANQAKALKENPVYVELIDTVETAIYSRMKESPIKDKEMHSQLVLQLQAVSAIRKQVEREIKNYESALRSEEAKKQAEKELI